MEEGDNILDAIYDEDHLDDDVDMIDVEEGELVEPNSQNVLGQSNAGDITEANQESNIENSKLGASKNMKKKKNKRKRKGSGSKVINIDRFVLDTCRRLKEKKSYMVYTAAGCLGISALSDIIKEIFLPDASLLLPILCLIFGVPGRITSLFTNCEGEMMTIDVVSFTNFNAVTNNFRAEIGYLLMSQVDAIQACGGQKTADGRRFRTGGGILWSIIKVREPKAYKEIMNRAKEFEKQFRQPNVKQLNAPKKEGSSQGQAFPFAGSDQGNVPDRAVLASEMKIQHEPVTNKEKSISVHDRLRIPVSYDDDLLGETPVNDAT